MILLSDNRINPFDQSQNARPFRLPPLEPNDIQDGVFYDELAISVVLPSDVIQLPQVGEDYGGKFQLWQESAPDSGVYSLQFVQVTGAPGVNQFRVAWGSGRSIVQINNADITATTGRRFACVYDGLGTVNGVKVNTTLLNAIRHVTADETSTTINSDLDVIGSLSVTEGDLKSNPGWARTATGWLIQAGDEQLLDGEVFYNFPVPFTRNPRGPLWFHVARQVANSAPLYGGNDYQYTINAYKNYLGFQLIASLYHNTSPPYHSANIIDNQLFNWIAIGY